jgi:cation diffusion facilitator CzcD-associated flavoprotein CzcO
MENPVKDCYDCTHYDVVVIGAGPHALALVTRLLERWPSSIISDTEHSRVHHLHSGKCHKNKRDETAPLTINGLNKRILVIDKYGEWMAKWDKSFRAYDIEHLRSPLFFHMDPSHPEALRAYAQKHNRSDELNDITNIVDNCKNYRQNSKKGRGFNFNHADREQFYTPGTRLFSDFCLDLIDRYNLYDMVVEGVCTRVDKTPKGFEVTYSCGENGCTKNTTIYANAVVCAIGNTNIKRIPDFVHDIKTNYPLSRISHANDFVDCLGALDHSSHDHSEIIPKQLAGKLFNHENTRLVVVGGGLTAAQVRVLSANQPDG